MRSLAGLLAVAAIATAQSGACRAQANADPGSALIGTSKAQEHAEARAKSNAPPMGQENKPAPAPAPSNDPKGSDEHH